MIPVVLYIFFLVQSSVGLRLSQVPSPHTINDVFVDQEVVNPEPSPKEITRISAEKRALGQALHDYIIANVDSICESEHSGQASSTTFLTVAAKLSGTYMEFLAADRQNLAKLNGNAEVCIVDHGLNSDRDPAWSKVVALRALLEVGKRNIVWMDADALAVNPTSFANIEAEFFPASKSILFTNDFDEGYEKDASTMSSINSGVMIIRNTAWSTRFWKSVWDDFPEALHNNNIVWEQKAILMYREANPTDFADNAHIIPHRIMNTGKLERKPEDFIIHAAGGHGKAKYDDLLKTYCNYTHLEPCRHIGLR